MRRSVKWHVAGFVFLGAACGGSNGPPGADDGEADSYAYSYAYSYADDGFGANPALPTDVSTPDGDLTLYGFAAGYGEAACAGIASDCGDPGPTCVDQIVSGLISFFALVAAEVQVDVSDCQLNQERARECLNGNWSCRIDVDGSYSELPPPPCDPLIGGIVDCGGYGS